MLKSQQKSGESGTTRERPPQVTMAVYLLYASVIIGATRILLHGLPTWAGYKIPKAALVATWHLFGVPFQVVYGDPFIVLMGFSLCYMVAKGRNWARIAFLIFVSLECLSVLSGLSGIMLNSFPLRLSDFWIGPSAEMSQMALQIVAVMLLFERGSSDWFKTMKTHHQ